MAWQDTWQELGDEVRAAKNAAIAEFMAAPADSDIGAAPAVPPVLSRQQLADAQQPLSTSDVSKLLTVSWRAISRAIQKHIGPVSSDGTIDIGIRTDSDGVQQLNLRAISNGVPPAPEAVTYRRYFCLIPDPLVRTPAKYVVAFGVDGSSQGWGLNWSQWTKIAGISTWQCNFNGPIWGYSPAQPTNRLMAEGDRFVVPLDLNVPFGTPSPHPGLYEVVQQGHGTRPSIIRRTFDANTSSGLVNGMAIKIEGDDLAYAVGQWYIAEISGTATVDTTDVVFNSPTGLPTSYSPVVKYELLTPVEVTSERASTTTELLTTAASSSNEPNGVQIGPDFVSLPISRSDIPAGTFGITALLRSPTFNGTSTCWFTFRMFLLHADTSEDEIVLDDDGLHSLPIVSGVDVTMSWQATLSAAVPCVPDDRLLVRGYFHSDQADGVDLLEWTYQNAMRPSFLEVTWEGSTSGVIRWVDILPVTQARYPMPTIAIGSGWLDIGTLDAGTNDARVSGCGPSAPLKGLTKPTLAGDQTAKCALVLDGKSPVQHNQTPPDSTKAPIYVPDLGLSSDRTYWPQATMATLHFRWLEAEAAWLLELST